MESNQADCACNPETTDDPKPTGNRGDGPDHVKPGRTIAFTAKLEISDSYPFHKGPLRFTNVLVNEGQGYSPLTGAFTCPRAGFYHFTVHASTYGLAQFMINKNGQNVVSAYHTTLDDKKSQVASIGSVIQLSESDKVWVELWGPPRNDIFATEANDTVFLGFRLG
ncbi:complement C1q tumor necrosis factor-related protein 5-like isoform X1 [Conger conger]|uniref:complement C1q tumor necrosis factor-related protein 5-like isoform X1 n=1 Tax=Conger conger TaxID=82655 RepID=UPI002A5AEE9B|nr:complement C1q tumor necrosis factor-related protein 5-like isoform X1 [Conger conger]